MFSAAITTTSEKSKKKKKKSPPNYGIEMHPKRGYFKSTYPLILKELLTSSTTTATNTFQLRTFGSETTTTTIQLAERNVNLQLNCDYNTLSWLTYAHTHIPAHILAYKLR